MELGKSYLKEAYDKNFKEGVNLKNRGNYPLAKEKFKGALIFLERLTAVSEGAEKEENRKRCEKLKLIIESLDSAIPKKPQPSRPSGTYTTQDDLSSPDGFDEVSAYITIIPLSDLRFGFEGVIGLDEAKDAVREYVINPIKYKEAYNYDFMNNRAVLLYGPPGTGKTTFAKAVAKETGLPFFLVNLSAIVNCYVGETSKNIDKIFSYMRRYTEENKTEILVFFDEFDEVAKKRTSEDKTSEAAVPALLRNLDGVKENDGFMILANTNHKEMLDPAILSRFRRKVLIPLPDESSRVKLFKLSLKEIEKETFDSLDFDRMSRNSDGYSGRDIAYIADDFKRLLSKRKAGLIECDDLDQAMEEIIKKRPSD